jgi:outer membrane protein assembly factor BamB
MNVNQERFKDGGAGFAGWRVRIGSGCGIPTPAFAGDSVIVGGGFGSYEVYALDVGTGRLRWQVDTEDDGPTAAVVLDGTALFNTESCTLMAVDAATGMVRWEKWLGDPLLAQPAAADGRVLMVFPRNESHWLGAFDLRTGKLQWKTRLEHDVITAPVVANGHVYVATWDGSVTCLDATDGRVC